MPTHPPPDSVRCQPRSASTSSANDAASIDLGTWSRNHALSSLRNASSADVNDRSTLRNCPPNAGAVNSYRGVQSSQALRGRTRGRSLLVGAVVQRLARRTGVAGAGTVTRGPSQHVARERGVADALPARVRRTPAQRTAPCVPVPFGATVTAATGGSHAPRSGACPLAFFAPPFAAAATRPLARARTSARSPH